MNFFSAWKHRGDRVFLFVNLLCVKLWFNLKEQECKLGTGWTWDKKKKERFIEANLKDGQPRFMCFICFLDVYSKLFFTWIQYIFLFVCRLIFNIHKGKSFNPFSWFNLFSSPELKAQVSFSDHLSSVVCLSVCPSICPSVCKLFTFSSSSPEPLVQFQPNLAHMHP